ncbi:nitric oxide reductase NorD protein [Candidatus Magnetomoraceae bacterium gMMP-15]
MNNHFLKKLSIADPELAEDIKSRISLKNLLISDDELSMLVEETILGLSQEFHFGKTIAFGFLELIGKVDFTGFETYQKLVREYGENGPSLGKIIAKHLVPVLKYSDKKLLSLFIQTVNVMNEKGSYTLSNPLKALSSILDSGDLDSGYSYLYLLTDTFSQYLTYNLSNHLSRFIPRFCLSLNSEKRSWQIEEFRQIVLADLHWCEPFEEGMEKGLSILSRDALQSFIAVGLNKFANNREPGSKFFSLQSKAGQESLDELQVAVSLVQISRKLNRYIQARTGMGLVVRPVSSLPGRFKYDPFTVCSDGKFIYLPDEIGILPSKEENTALYKCLAGLEAGHCEMGSFDFDLEKALDLCRKQVDIKHDQGISDLESFFELFSSPALAFDLFIIFEQGRVRKLLSKLYPGLARKSIPVIHKEALSFIKKQKTFDPVFYLYARIALGMSDADWELKDVDFLVLSDMNSFADLFEKYVNENQQVEISAKLVWAIYDDMQKLLNLKQGWKALKIPFGRRLRPELAVYADQIRENKARHIKQKLGEKGVKLYKSDVKKRLSENNGRFSLKDIRELSVNIEKDQDQNQVDPSLIDISQIDLSELFDDPSIIEPAYEPGPSCPIFWYKEWDNNAGDYLINHTRVLCKTLKGIESNFYKDTLKRYPGILRRIRRNFEMLRPEGLIILRRWLEGDDFDYRVLIDYAIDRKIKKTPSERLYIKRVKQQRDVAVLLLVDLSRSTANTLPDSDNTVLKVEKEAIILFCEALQTAGDSFAIAGFSGTGRLGVDYFQIKDFKEDLNDDIKKRINSMSPCRSTRMGAAIRHSTDVLAKIPSKVRLLIILGDGFPNDLDYKRDYAIKDTHKAINEARAKGIYSHGITVNLSNAARLDELYGKGRHNLISDVLELPDKLPRIYRALTKQ